MFTYVSMFKKIQHILLPDTTLYYKYQNYNAQMQTRLFQKISRLKPDTEEISVINRISLTLPVLIVR